MMEVLQRGPLVFRLPALLILQALLEVYPLYLCVQELLRVVQCIGPEAVVWQY